MEADSTTYDNLKSLINEPCLPFPTNPGNYKLYKDFTAANSERSLDSQLIERLQEFGLIPSAIKCPSNKDDCKVICKSARVIDRVQWVCEGCGKRQPIRLESFFFKLQCSMLQTMQIILAWCEDADLEVAAEHFGVKTKVASVIYDRLNDLAIKEHTKHVLGGEDSVVLAELYPDCVNGLSPDTTDQPHVHRILMLADTNHIPTYYRLHVIKDDAKTAKCSSDAEALKAEIEAVISQATIPNSTIVIGNNLPLIDGASTIQQLVQYCDVDMQRFLTSRVWRQAITLCAASRDLCAAGGAGGVAGAGGGAPVAGGGAEGAGGGAGGARACAGGVQRYVDAALHRLRHADEFYAHTLTLVAAEYTH